MMKACLLNFVINPTHRKGIRRSDVRFLMGNSEFFLCLTLVTGQKNLNSLIIDWCQAKL